MNSAAVLIGVDRTGGLPVLRDAARSARRMERWAKAQKVEHVKVLTDEDDGSVHMQEVKKAIRDLNDLGTVERLIVFFAGHGINVNRGERWLLSEAPGDPQEAVNVPGSADLARWGGIPYVAMISDACRTAASSIQTQGLTGSEIFPNEENAELELPVDQFFACRLGRPSFEIANANAQKTKYRAIYTAALLKALEGRDGSPIDDQGYVRPRPLKEFLQGEMTRRLKNLDPASQVIQVPDAHIASDGNAWLSRIGEHRRDPARPARPDPAVPDASTQQRAYLTFAHPRIPRRSAADRVLDDLLDAGLHSPDPGSFDVRVDRARDSDEPRAVDIAAAVERASTPFSPTLATTNCGFKVRGARVTDVAAGAVGVRQTSTRFVHVEPRESPTDWSYRLDAWRRGGTVLLVLDHVLGVALPAIPEFIASVTVADGEVVEVAYEPAAGTRRWHDFNLQAKRVRDLRAVAAAASREGAFALERDDAIVVARRMQYAKSIDPALAVYAAYAYADRGRRVLVDDMWMRMVGDLGGALFDVALLLPRGRSDNERGGAEHDLSKFTLGLGPLLAQGWALLPASRLELAPALRGLEHHVLPGSLWTAYDPEGIERIRAALLSGTVR